MPRAFPHHRFQVQVLLHRLQEMEINLSKAVVPHFMACWTTAAPDVLAVGQGSNMGAAFLLSLVLQLFASSLLSASRVVPSQHCSRDIG